MHGLACNHHVKIIYHCGRDLFYYYTCYLYISVKIYGYKIVQYVFVTIDMHDLCI